MARKHRQAELRVVRWGGKRGSLGRVPHTTRPAVASRHPLLVTVRLRAGLPSLRRRDAFAVLEDTLAAGAERFGFRLVHHSVQSNHLHLIAEARDAAALGRGMKGLLVRAARRLNRLWRRKGPLVADAYHARALKTPREVRNALVYVLQNARKHGHRLAGLDPCSSAESFDGWKRARKRDERVLPSRLARAMTWLLAVGWRRHGLIDIGEGPAQR